MKALVTGGTGFLGTHLVDALRQQGVQVHVVARSPSSCWLNARPDVGVSIGKITDESVLVEATIGVDVIYHFAAIHAPWGIPYEQYARVNVGLVTTLLKLARQQGQRLVYCSSVGVLGGNLLYLPADEKHPCLSPTSKVAYHRTTAQAEYLVQNAGLRGDVSTSVVRPAIIYGSGDQTGLLTRMATLLQRRLFINVGSGTNLMHLVYVDDVVQGLILAANSGCRNGEVFHLAGPSPIASHALIARLCTFLHVPRPRFRLSPSLARAAGLGFELLYGARNLVGLDHIGGPPPLTRDRVAALTAHEYYDDSRARRVLGYRPTIGLDEGLTRFVNWFEVRHVTCESNRSRHATTNGTTA